MLFFQRWALLLFIVSITILIILLNFIYIKDYKVLIGRKLESSKSLSDGYDLVNSNSRNHPGWTGIHIRSTAVTDVAPGSRVSLLEDRDIGSSGIFKEYEVKSVDEKKRVIFLEIEKAELSYYNSDIVVKLEIGKISIFDSYSRIFSNALLNKW